MRGSRKLMAVAAAAALSLASSAFASPLWDNGPFVTGTGNGFNGSNTSQIGQANGAGPTGTTFGPGIQMVSGATTVDNRVADNFTVPAGPGWNVTSVTVYSYQTQTNTFPPTGTFTGAFAGIYSFQPVNRNDPADVQGGTWWTGASLPFTQSWTGAYRVTSTTLTNSQRAIFAIEIDIPDITLAPGTYWLGWNLSGSIASGPWGVPVTNPTGVSGSTTRNALQSVSTGTTWANLVDTGFAAGDQQYDLAFLVNGTVVPEPTSLALIGLGGLALLARRRNA